MLTDELTKSEIQAVQGDQSRREDSYPFKDEQAPEQPPGVITQNDHGHPHDWLSQVFHRR